MATNINMKNMKTVTTTPTTAAPAKAVAATTDTKRAPKAAAPKAKTAPKAAPAKIVPVARPNVLSFRLSNAENTKLTDCFNRDRMIMIGSVKQLARKLVTDYLAGRLVYKKQADRATNFDAQM
jgi:hypothetical protein